MKKNILLHTCCGPCALYVISQLQKNYAVTVYFYNPNIHPFEEYEKRKFQIEKYCIENNIEFIEAKYDIEKWDKRTKGLEHEPERGKRCDTCFEIRLESAAKFAKENNFEIFATTLTISPHKQAKVINDIGKDLAQKLGIEFLDIDWKKQEGFKITMRMAREQDFYIQKYCGCRFR